jgi:hypothetical protein
MSYLTSKKIYPGNWTNALNGWYKNIDITDDGTNTNNASKAAPLRCWLLLAIVISNNAVMP